MARSERVGGGSRAREASAEQLENHAEQLDRVASA
jgi:hypothetical protein